MSDARPSKPTEEKRRRRRSDAIKIVERNQAVHVVLRRTMGAALVAFLAMAVSVICALGIYGRPVPPVYLPVTETGNLLPLTPLDQPNMDRGAIGTFALEAVHALNTYDYINWRDQLAAAASYFSPNGWDEYQKLLAQSQTIQAVQSRKMIVSIKPTGQITVPQSGVNPAHIYIWKVEVPVEVDYTAHALTAQGQPDGGSKQVGTITLFISRVPTTVNPQGVAVQLYRFELNPNPGS